jgi:hypothetical protein
MGGPAKDDGWPLPPNVAARLAARRQRSGAEDASVLLGEVIAEVMAELKACVVENDGRGE